MKKFPAVLVPLAAVALGLFPAIASAAETSTYICVPETAGSAVTSGGSKGECAAKNTSVALPPTAQLATLQGILPHIKYVEAGIDKKPTIQFSGVNVQIINGEGKTATTNGEGNLVIGYDENSNEWQQSGSHNLILGEQQKFTSYGGIVAGRLNWITAPFASVVGGLANHAEGENASISGGDENDATGTRSSVSGGQDNKATAYFSSVSGGTNNDASTDGGASVGGGHYNTASGGDAWVGGGYKNVAGGLYAAIFGGKELKAEKEYEAIP